MAGKIFVNYRRGDDPGFTQALFGRLEQGFLPDQLFMDVDGIAPGQDFVRVLEQQVSECAIFISVIGKGWLDARDEKGARRLDNSDDYVRIEIEHALNQSKLVVPVLVGETQMPRPEELPETIRPLARRNAVRLTHERFRTDTQSLVESLRQALGEIESHNPIATRSKGERRAESSQRRETTAWHPSRLTIVVGSGIALVFVIGVSSIWLQKKTMIEIAQPSVSPLQGAASQSASAPIQEATRRPSVQGPSVLNPESAATAIKSAQQAQVPGAPPAAPQALSIGTRQAAAGSTPPHDSIVAPDPSQADGLFTAQDMHRVRVIADEHKLEVMPPFKIERPDLKLPGSLRKFVGVWSSEIGFGSGTARHAMLIVTNVEAPTRAIGYWIWGSPTAHEARQFPAGVEPFEGNVAGNQLTFRESSYSVTATLTPGENLTIVQTRDSGQIAHVTLNSVWRLVDAEQSTQATSTSHRP